MLLLASGITLAVLFLISVFVIQVLKSLKHQSVWSGPRLPSHETPKLLPDCINYKRLKVLGNDTVSIYYSFSFSDVPYRPWIVYCHGMMTNCESDLSVFSELVKEYNVLMWDYRGFGRSTGQADEMVTTYDLHYVLCWLEKAYEVDPVEDVVLMGRSLGTNIILNYVKSRSVLPDRIILCHPFYSLHDVFGAWKIPSGLAYVVGNMKRKGILKQYLEADEKRQALVVGTSEDTITPWHSALEECLEAGDRAIIKDVGGDHYAVPPQMWAEINVFLS